MSNPSLHLQTLYHVLNNRYKGGKPTLNIRQKVGELAKIVVNDNVITPRDYRVLKHRVPFIEAKYLTLDELASDLTRYDSFGEKNGKGVGKERVRQIEFDTTHTILRYILGEKEYQNLDF